MTKAKEIISELEKTFPNGLRAKWDMTDGLISGDINNNVKRAIVSLEFRENFTDKDIDMLILHHPPIFGSEKSITNPFYKESKMGKTVIYAIHSRLDKPGVVSKAIAERLFDSKFELKKVLEDGTSIIELKNPLHIEEIIKIIKEKIKIKYLNTIINNNTVNRIAIHGGEGFNQHHVDDAMKENIDLYLAGDMTHHLAEHAHFFNANFIDIGHFSEQEGMRELTSLLKKKFPEIEFIYKEQQPLWTIK